MGNHPKFQNEIGVPPVGIGCREFECIGARQLAEEPIPFSELADEFHVSRERVRQIGISALEKVQKAVKNRIAVMERQILSRSH
jgi:predicted DNA-binding protein (UPF0251 family)